MSLHDRQLHSLPPDNGPVVTNRTCVPGATSAIRRRGPRFNSQVAQSRLKGSLAGLLVQAVFLFARPL
jgi:hypothetical protein